MRRCPFIGKLKPRTTSVHLPSKLEPMRLRALHSLFSSFIDLLLVALAFIPLPSEAQLRIVCWGNPGTTNVPANLTNIRSIAAGYNHCLVLLSNGTVVAWGDN